MGLIFHLGSGFLCRSFLYLWLGTHLKFLSWDWLFLRTQIVCHNTMGSWIFLSILSWRGSPTNVILYSVSLYLDEFAYRHILNSSCQQFRLVPSYQCWRRGVSTWPLRVRRGWWLQLFISRLCFVFICGIALNPILLLNLKVRKQTCE